MTITIEEEIPADLGFDCLSFAKEVISFTLLHEKFPFEAEVNLTLTDNEAIQELNRDYRNIDAATDVLSFPMLNLTEAGKFSSIGQDIENNFNPDRQRRSDAWGYCNFRAESEGAGGGFWPFCQTGVCIFNCT